METLLSERWTDLRFLSVETEKAHKKRIAQYSLKDKPFSNKKALPGRQQGLLVGLRTKFKG